jgi:hypothetical protein
MKIDCIFAVVKESLFAVKYKSENEHELTRIFRLWNDAEYLFSFFHEQAHDLQHPFWKGISVAEAVMKTRREAKRIQNKLITIADTGKTDKDENLSTLFKPLYDNISYLEQYEKNKAYGLDRPSWLRIYAIRVDVNMFIVSGGAIKLTKSMNDRDHLLLELSKLEILKKYCRDNFNLEAELMEL